MIDLWQDYWNPNRWYLDFDRASPGGRGGASLLCDATQSFVSIDGVHRNDFLPKRSTGKLLAEAFVVAGMPKPAIIEGYNVYEKSTLAALIGGSDGRGTVIGNLFEVLVNALGGVIIHWEPVPYYSGFHLWVHVEYP